MNDDAWIREQRLLRDEELRSQGKKSYDPDPKPVEKSKRGKK